MIQVIYHPSQKLEIPLLEASPCGYDHVKEEAKQLDLEGDSNNSELSIMGLPLDIEDLVLARLPISMLYKARLVCKRWHSLLTFPPFLKLRNDIQGQQESTFFPLVFWHDGKATERISHTGSRPQSKDDLVAIRPKTASVIGQAYNQFTTWSWLGYDSSRRKWQAMKSFTTPVDVKNLVTGSNGLLCLRGENCLLVINPMTNVQRLVPLQENVAQLVVNTESNSFKILCASSRRRTKIYDSQTRLWCKRGRPAPNLSLSRHSGTYCEGVLYCVAREEMSGLLGVIKYNVEGARTWSDLMLFPSEVGETCVKAKLIYFGGEVFALVEKEIRENDTDSWTKSLVLWKLERTSFKWRLAGKTPAQSLQHLEDLVDFDCVALNNRLCILNKSTFKAVVCFVSNGVVTSWHEYPLESYLAANTPLVERCIVQFPFEPSLLVSV